MPDNHERFKISPACHTCSRRFVFYTTRLVTAQGEVENFGTLRPNPASDFKLMFIHHRLATHAPDTFQSKSAAPLAIEICGPVSRAAAKECSPRRKPWVRRPTESSPGGAKECSPQRKPWAEGRKKNVAHLRPYPAAIDLQNTPTPPSNQIRIPR